MTGIGFKDKVDQHPVMVVGSFMVAAFIAGVSAMGFLIDHKSGSDTGDVSGLIQQIREVLEQNVQLKLENSQLKGQISPQKADETKQKADEIIGGINLDDIREHGILGGPNSFFRKPFG